MVCGYSRFVVWVISHTCNFAGAPAKTEKQHPCILAPHRCPGNYDTDNRFYAHFYEGAHIFGIIYFSYGVGADPGGTNAGNAESNGGLEITGKKVYNEKQLCLLVMRTLYAGTR